MHLSVLELAFVAPLFLLCAGTLIRNWRHGPVSIWSPMSLIALLYFYYTVAGPLYFIATDNTDFLGVDFRPLYWKGWGASLLSFIFVAAGYLSFQGNKKKIGRVCSDEVLMKFAAWLFGISFVAILYGLASNNDLANAFNPLASDGDVEALRTSEMTTFRFAGFWVNLINLSIAAIVLSFLIWLQRRTRISLYLMLFALVFSLAYFVRTGFRFRIAWLTVAMAAAYFLWKKTRPNLLLVGASGLIFIAVMGLIGMTRNYYGGLKLENAQGASFASYVDRGFGEAGIFISLCSVVDSIPEKIPYTTWDPLWITLTLPIPRMLWEAKPESQTLLAMGQSFGATGGEQAGQAIPFFGEWYIAFGWIGVVLSSLLFGWLCKILWVWFLQRREDNLVILIYTVNLGYLYFVFSRGYTPLMVMNFIFGLFPFFVFYGWLRRKAFLRALDNILRAKSTFERTERMNKVMAGKRHPDA